MHQCVLCMGSNVEGESILKQVFNILSNHFDSVRASRIMKTQAIGEQYLSPFHNQVLAVTTSLESTEIKRICKQIEKDFGRLPEDKAKGIVKLDIDLILYDTECLKPKDICLPYVQEGIKQITNTKQKSL